MELWFRDGASAQQLQQRVQQIVQTMASARSAPWFSSLLVRNNDVLDET